MLEWLKVIGLVVYDRRMRHRVFGYRPVVMCVIQATESEKFLFIRPSAKPDAWMVPQEGIEPDESVEDAAMRGLQAELGVVENQLHFRRSTWLGRKEIPEQRNERDVQYSLVAMRGKAYYGALIRMPEATTLRSNPAEIAEYTWLNIDEIRQRLQTNTTRKQELLRAAFRALVNIHL